MMDLALARRLERAEAAANARFVESRARTMPETHAEWIEVAGTYAMFDGPDSPCTQTFGLGLFAEASAADLDCIERFFAERGAPAFHEVSPLADKALLGLLTGRGYQPFELSNVLVLGLDGNLPAPLAGLPTVRTAREEERETWARTAAAGWSDVIGDSAMMENLMRVVAARESAVDFVAEWEGTPIATGALAIHEGVALFAGASTLPDWRKRGAQRALFAGRLQYALEAGCDLTMVVSEPGSATQRNAERAGFQVAYTRMNWKRG
jgi:hypothetical protein